ncbi:MAG: ATPase [Chlorobi bacterium]|nr:ATPase [Chlorobiota bacterium]
MKLRIKVKAEPEDIYAALTNPFAIELWTDSPAVMSTEPGSEFELWEGAIAGRNIEFEENFKIVQEWYFGDRPEQSIVTIKLFKQGGKTQIEVTQTNIPEEDYEDIKEGWEESYLGAIKEFVEVD